MDFILDITFLEAWVGQKPWWVVWQVIRYGGWVPFLLVFIWGGWRLWLSHIRKKFITSIQYVLLAIDVPRYNQQGPKAVEQLFAHLYGMKEKKDWVKRYFRGYIQSGISLELISIEGYIQFLIRCPVESRDLVEAAVYACYPDAEITETDDYTKNAPEKFPDEDYQLWGSELTLYNKEAYPIRTYPNFEDPTARERFKDPMASLLETLGKFQRGERLWIQFLIVPVGDDWKRGGELIVKKMTEQEVPSQKTKIEKISEFPLTAIGRMGDIVSTWGEPVDSQTSHKSMAAIFTPGLRRVLEAVQNKVSKTGFGTKIRIVYLARKEVYSKPKAVAGILGAINQYNTLDMNGFKTDKLTKTKKKRWWAELRWPFWLSPIKEFYRKQNKILKNYKYRDNIGGSSRFVLNTEELATLFHFPVSTVEAPMVKKTGSRRAEPPFDLPVVEDEGLPISKKRPPAVGEKAPPPELPTEE